MRDYRRLDVWNRAHRFVLDLHRLTRSYPRDERFELVSHTRRTARSIPTNLAEGSSRGSDNDYARFVRYAIGSSAELEYHLLLARDLDYIPPSEHEVLQRELGEIRGMLNGLLRALTAD